MRGKLLLKILVYVYGLFFKKSSEKKNIYIVAEKYVSRRCNQKLIINVVFYCQGNLYLQIHLVISDSFIANFTLSDPKCP